MTAAERVLHAATCELLDRDPIPTWEQWQAEAGDDEDFGHEEYDLLAAAALG